MLSIILSFLLPISVIGIAPFGAATQSDPNVAYAWETNVPSVKTSISIEKIPLQWGAACDFEAPFSFIYYPVPAGETSVIVPLEDGYCYISMLTVEDQFGHEAHAYTGIVSIHETDAPIIVSKSPTGKHIRRGANIKITFSEKIKAYGWKYAIILKDTKTKQKIRCTYQFDGDRYVVVNPSVRLASNRTYRVIVGRDTIIEDRWGNELESTSWKFTTN